MNSKQNPKAPSGPPAAVWRFMAVVFDELKWELRVAGQLVELEPRPLEILLCLLRHAGETVTREELLLAVWGHAHLSENTLSNAIGKLRRALGDDEQSMIVTVHRVGYRLAVPVLRQEIAGARHSALSLKVGDVVPRRETLRLLRPLGTGGSGEVWLAAEDNGESQRVFKFSADGARLSSLKREATLSRLLRETLGERRDIVRVLDWNFEEPPFFIECEYGGFSLPEWSERQGGLGELPLARRLDLMAQIGDAVAAAHSVGVLHKDLKPANVLIDPDARGQPMIRLIDFGSGGLTDPARLAELGMTRTGFSRTLPADSLSGTPMYLAPELLLGHSPTVQSDLYALGVMLYQLVVGDLRHPMAPGWEREIDDPLLRQDIADAASGKPERRLSSAKELVERLRTLDTRRQRERAAVDQQARADAMRLVLQQARARRPWIVTVGLALSAGLALSLWFFRQSEQSRNEALQQVGITQAVNNFLNNDLLAAANPNIGGAANITVLDAIRKATGKIDERFAQSPSIALALHQTVGGAYRTVGNYAAAEAEFRRAQNIAETSRGPSSEPAMENALLLAQDLAYENDYAEARRLIEQVERLMRNQSFAASMIPVHLWDVRSLLDRHETNLVAAAADAEHALAALRELKALHPEMYAANAQSVFLTRLHIAQARQDAGHNADAESLERELLKETVAGGAIDPLTIRTQQQLAGNLIDQGRVDEAGAVLPALLRNADQLLGVGNPIYLNILRDQARLDQQLRHWPDALAASEKAEQGYTQLYGPQNDSTVQSMLDTAGILAAAGRGEQAIAKYQRAYAIAIDVQGTEGLLVQLIAYDLVSSYLAAGRWQDAAPLLEKLQASKLQNAEPDRPWSARLDYQHGRLAQLSGGHDAARRYLEASLNDMKAGAPDETLRILVKSELAKF